MKLIDLLIIYFACSAPFGVYQATISPRPLTSTAALQFLLRISCWPVFGALVLIEWFFRNQQSVKSNFERHTASIRSQIESLVFADASISSIFDFREILRRYAGLSEAVNGAPGSSPGTELFEVSKNEDKELASTCLTRKNRRRLSFHQSLARNEFVDMISEFAAADKEGARILGLAIELANDVNDQEAACTLTAIMSETICQANVPAQASEHEIAHLTTRSVSHPM